MPGHCHVVLSLMREEKPFTQPEFRRLRRWHPPSLALMRRHRVGLEQEFATRSTPKPELTGQGLDRLTAREREIVG